ncbi:MAG TPA: hypothetical protein PK954_12545 [Anaerolineales bacterium]|nr:hypothetical protein [Anaerolineales bacterium]HRF49036.1 hypothetical protein [Anaerolineales bacterium]
MNPASHLDDLSLGEAAVLAAADHLAQYHKTPSSKLRWRIAQDFEQAGDLERARLWYRSLARGTQPLAALAACRLDELANGPELGD